MNTEDLKKTLDYIQEHNSWENMVDAADNNRHIYKYVDINICYDTRDTDDGRDPHVWYVKISLRDGGKVKEFREAECTFENIKKFLDLPIMEASKQMKDNK